VRTLAATPAAAAAVDRHHRPPFIRIAAAVSARVDVDVVGVMDERVSRFSSEFDFQGVGAETNITEILCMSLANRSVWW
jgi:hypothetical protein